MADPVYPLVPDEDLPELGTYNAIGTMLRELINGLESFADYSVRHGAVREVATSWLEKRFAGSRRSMDPPSTPCPALQRPARGGLRRRKRLCRSRHLVHPRQLAAPSRGLVPPDAIAERPGAIAGVGSRMRPGGCALELAAVFHPAVLDDHDLRPARPA
jgi:hypothetical protein